MFATILYISHSLILHFLYSALIETNNLLYYNYCGLLLPLS